jgi:hypothetical protein
MTYGKFKKLKIISNIPILLLAIYLDSKMLSLVPTLQPILLPKSTHPIINPIQSLLKKDSLLRPNFSHLYLKKAFLETPLNSNLNHKSSSKLLLILKPLLSPMTPLMKTHLKYYLWKNHKSKASHQLNINLNSKKLIPFSTLLLIESPP